MESWAASISDRMARIEETLQTIHAECRLLRGELTGAVRDNEDCDGIVEEKTTTEIVEKIAWGVEKIKDKMFSHNVRERHCSGDTAADPELVDDGTNDVIPGESELESGGENTGDLDLDMITQEEEEIMALQQLSLPGPQAKSDEEESKRLLDECWKIIQAQRLINLYENVIKDEKVAYALIWLDNKSIRAIVDTEVTVLGGKHTYEHSKPIKAGEQVRFTVNPYHNPGDVQFVISTTMDGTDEKLCLVGHIIYPQAFASAAIVRRSIQIPSSGDGLAAFINKISSQEDDYRRDVVHYRPVPSSKTYRTKIISARAMTANVTMYVATPDASRNYVYILINILEVPDSPNFVKSSLRRDLNMPFTFPNLQTVITTKFPSVFKTGSVPCGRSCIVDLTNVSSTALNSLQENFANHKMKTTAPIFIDPLKPMSRIVTWLPAFKKSPNYIGYHLEGTDLGLMVYWNVDEQSNSFALAFVPENLVMDSKLKKAMLIQDEFGHRPDRDVVHVVDEPQAFTINCRNVFAWASLSPGRNARLKIVVYTV